MRTSNWPTKLARFIESRRNTKFDWKDNNCAFFVCDWLFILIGEDLASSFRGKVESRETAHEALKPYGGLVGLIEFEAERRGWATLDHKTAQRGDIGVFNGDYGPVVGVVCGKYMAMIGPDRLELVLLSDCVKFWAVR